MGKLSSILLGTVCVAVALFLTSEKGRVTSQAQDFINLKEDLKAEYAI